MAVVFSKEASDRTPASIYHDSQKEELFHERFLKFTLGYSKWSNGQKRQKSITSPENGQRKPV
jgi:hypothetical protein